MVLSRFAGVLDFHSMPVIASLASGVVATAVAFYFAGFKLGLLASEVTMPLALGAAIFVGFAVGGITYLSLRPSN